MSDNTNNPTANDSNPGQLMFGDPIPPVDYDNPQTDLYITMEAECIAAILIMQSRREEIDNSRGLPDHTPEMEAIFERDLAEMEQMRPAVVWKMTVLGVLLATIQISQGMRSGRPRASGSD
ncbi:hypothetical protein H0H93_008919 [Arthromyces matolae]|nr:hypothetical protein H0H93_008919 [Arthromyces matolae]